MQNIFVRWSCILVCLLLNPGCGDDSSGTRTDTSITPQEKYRAIVFSGFAQKGPLQNGSTIKIYELDSDFKQNGDAYQTKIINDLGEYHLPVNLNSRYVEIYAEGYYYDEVAGRLSVSWLTLDALADTYDTGGFNINLLTTLTKSRIIKLISEGHTFSNANAQAQQEVLGAFGLASGINVAFIHMNLFGFEQKDLCLVTISSLFMQIAHMTEAMLPASALSKWIAVISADLQDNGCIDDLQTRESIDQAILRIRPARIKKLFDSRFKGRPLQSFENVINLLINDFAFDNVAKYAVSARCTIDFAARGSSLFLGLSAGSNFVLMVDSQGRMFGTYGNNEGYIEGTVHSNGLFEAFVSPKDIPDTRLAVIDGAITGTGALNGSFQALLPIYRHSQGTLTGYRFTK